MPSVSLVVCVYRERDLTERLLREVSGCFDDLVVIHDGSEISSGAETDIPRAADFASKFASQEFLDSYAKAPKTPMLGSLQELTQANGGRFYIHPRIGSLEGQSPFAWSRARHDWILRLDADEVPSKPLKEWLRIFRDSPEPASHTSGYTCLWPLWDGEKMVTQRWPGGRMFLFHRQRVRFFGIVEQVPLPDGCLEPLNLVLEHRPKRKSYGLANILFRRQAYRWRASIAESLLGKPTDRPCWRWTDEVWPAVWEQIRQSPLKTGLRRLLIWPLRTLRDQWRNEGKLLPFAALSGGVHHFLICLKYWSLRRKGSLANR